MQQLFIDMQVLVKEQGEVINQIENNVQDANKNTEQGVEELKTAVVYQVNKIFDNFKLFFCIIYIIIFNLNFNIYLIFLIFFIFLYTY